MYNGAPTTIFFVVGGKSKVEIKSNNKIMATISQSLGDFWWM